MKAFPIFRQLDQMDCGPTCLRMVAKYYGKDFSIEQLKEMSNITREGVTLLGLSEAAENIGFNTLKVKLSFEDLDEEVPLPCILHWNQNHFVVLPPQTYSHKKKKTKILIADPAFGLVKVDRETFTKNWIGQGESKGIALVIEPTDHFYKQREQKEEEGFNFLLRYLRPHKKFIVQLFLSILLTSLLALIFPFLTQGIVDHGVNLHDIGFIKLILISQLVLVLGNTAIDSIRNWILLHMNSRINISIISDFLIKLMKLPIRYFDTKMIGDITQRIADHRKIEAFLANDTLSTLFSIVTLLVFSIVLSIYSVKIVLLFLIGSVLSVLWIVFFLQRRKDLDYLQFQERSHNQNSIFELIEGMQEIKINNCEIQKRWEWQRSQIRLFKLNVKGLNLGQYQKIGNVFILQIKNILISYIAAVEVVNGNMTLGMMLSVSYIIGQMNSPIEQLLNFIRSFQDAKISIQRLNEVHGKADEDDNNQSLVSPHDESGNVTINNDIHFKDVSFKYEKTSANPFVLKNINISIPKGKITAIVGASGSGKTTLMKLLLRFYQPINGSIRLGDTDFQVLTHKSWRKQCGVVMQEGFIFSDTIARNIAIGTEKINEKKLLEAVRIANIEEFIDNLPLRYQTKIGSTGNGISTGQKLRILIARAVYKEPQYLFFDEATSSLDANNEKIIIENLNSFFKGRTVLVIAHRLSTVKNADQIIVLNKGEVVEIGDHQSLISRKGSYFELIKNQLELAD